MEDSVGVVWTRRCVSNPVCEIGLVFNNHKVFSNTENYQQHLTKNTIEHETSEEKQQGRCDGIGVGKAPLSMLNAPSGFKERVVLENNVEIDYKAVEFDIIRHSNTTILRVIAH